MISTIHCIYNYVLCIYYSGVGFTNGEVRVLSSLSLEDETETFHYAKDCITHLIFSHDSMYMATAVRYIHTYIHTTDTHT